MEGKAETHRWTEWRCVCDRPPSECKCLFMRSKVCINYRKPSLTMTTQSEIWIITKLLDVFNSWLSFFFCPVYLIFLCNSGTRSTHLSGWVLVFILATQVSRVCLVCKLLLCPSDEERSRAAEAMHICIFQITIHAISWRSLSHYI